MKQSFEEFLQEYVCRTEPCTDDLLPEIYADWICEVDPELIVELAEKWHKDELNEYRWELRKQMAIFSDDIRHEMDEAIRGALAKRLERIKGGNK